MSKYLKQKLQKWLEIKDHSDDISRFNKWDDDISRFNKWDKEFWKHRQLLKQRVKAKCEGCGKTIMLWPLETEAYYSKDGKVYHSKCYALKRSRLK